jgi:hypothetical protein
VTALLRTLGLVALVVLLGQPLAAQWPAHRTPGVPRLPDGAPDLDAPVPRTADGKPDLSGVWRAARTPGFPPIDDPQPPDGPPIATLGNVASRMPEDWLPMRPWAVELVRQRRADNSKDNPEANCLPMGIMQFHTQGYPRRFIQTPTLLAILYEAWHGYRQIYMDGRSLPPPDPDRQPSWYGYSAGRWDGDALVVESNGFRDDGWLDIPGHPLTRAATVTERFTRTSFGRMTIDVTIDDPQAYTRPFTVRVLQRIIVDQDMMEMICQENLKFYVSEGVRK